jgi:hypothetical protein
VGYLSTSGSKLVTEVQILFYVSASFFSLVVPHIFTLIDYYQLYLSAGAIANFMIASSMLYFVRTFSLKIYLLFWSRAHSLSQPKEGWVGVKILTKESQS